VSVTRSDTGVGRADQRIRDDVGECLLIVGHVVARLGEEHLKAFAVLITAVELQRKVQAIKRIREITGVCLAQGKTMAEQLPSTVVDSLYRWQARFLAARLRDIGMTVEVVEDSSHRPHLQPFRKLKF
jgi:ribosomal protein L7/L12